MSLEPSSASASSTLETFVSPERNDHVASLTSPVIDHPTVSITPASLQPTVAASPKWLGLMFALTILVSAFLLFQVQPLISKFILPWFGGSPAVWTTCMLFFQLTLFGGYAYAHLLTRYFSHRGQGTVHLLLIAVALALALPTIAPSVTWKPLDPSHATGRILWLLAATVGVPYFVLSTTGPLVQAWFAQTWPGKSPYRLYALSNLGSLAALVTFPFVFEPAFASDTQAGMWTAVFGLFAALCCACAVWILRVPQSNLSIDAEAAGIGSTAGANTSAHDTISNGGRLTLASQQPAIGRRILWILLPACASLMLLATTNYVCQDVAVIPFLWVVPLALYLLTFIICFDHPRWFRPVAMSVLALALLMLSAGAADDLCDLFSWKENILHELALYFGTMFFACLVCHGQLVRLRPAPKFLTEYYLMISAGGALGGVFVSLIAPHIFRTHFEWTLALAACLIVTAAVLVISVKNWAGALPGRAFGKWLGFATAAVALIGSVHWLTAGARGSADAIYRARNFYGTVAVLESDRDQPEMTYRTFLSGSIRHGRQWTAPDKRRLPISYFAENTGVGRTLTYFQNNSNAKIGVVGMGVGVVATYARPGQYVRFYEINEQVDKIAHDYFTFLSDCQGKYDVVLSDARLALERELAEGKPQNFDVLILDAFTADAPPVHLLTDEAFGIYLKHMKPDGVIVVNMTNRNINLAPVITGVAQKYGLGLTRVMTHPDSDKLLYGTDFMMLTNNQDFLAAMPPVLIKEYMQPDYQVPLFTDKFSNLFSILKK